MGKTLLKISLAIIGALSGLYLIASYKFPVLAFHLVSANLLYYQTNYPHFGTLMFYADRAVLLLFTAAVVYVAAFLLKNPDYTLSAAKTIKRYFQKLNAKTNALLIKVTPQYELPPLVLTPAFLLTCIILIGAILRLYFALTIPLLPNEGNYRLLEAKEWIDSRQGIPGNLVWLPLHHLIIGLPYMLGFDLLWGSCLITVFIGIVTLFAVYYAVKIRFGVNVAIVSCFLLAINPFHVYFSTIAMSEVPFIFFAYGSLGFLFYYLRTGKGYFLVLSSICINCCNAIRFEGWLLTAALTLVLFAYKKNILLFIRYGAMNMVFVILYILVSFFTTHHLLFGLYMSDMVVSHLAKDRGSIFIYAWRGLYLGAIMDRVLLLFAFTGALMALYKAKEIAWLLVAGFLLSFLNWKVFTGTTEPFGRYYSTGLYLLLPFAALALTRLFKITRVGALLAFLIICANAAEGLKVQYRNALAITGTTSKYDGAVWIKKHRQDHEKILLFGSPEDIPPFLMVSNTNTNLIYQPMDSAYTWEPGYEDFNSEVLLRVMKEPGYKYLVYGKGSLDSIWALPMIANEMEQKGIMLKRVFTDTHFSIDSIGLKR